MHSTGLLWRNRTGSVLRPFSRSRVKLTSELPYQCLQGSSLTPVILIFSMFTQGDRGENGYDGQPGPVGDIGLPGLWDPNQMEFYAGPPGEISFNCNVVLSPNVRMYDISLNSKKMEDTSRSKKRSIVSVISM